MQSSSKSEERNLELTSPLWALTSLFPLDQPTFCTAAVQPLRLQGPSPQSLAMGVPVGKGLTPFLAWLGPHKLLLPLLSLCS